MTKTINRFINNETLQIYFRLFIILLAFFTQNLLTEIIAWLIAITISVNMLRIIKSRIAKQRLDKSQIVSSILIITMAALNVIKNLAILFKIL